MDSNTDYYLVIRAAEGARNPNGSYILVLDMGQGKIPLEDGTSGMLGRSDTEDGGTLSVNKTQLFRFDLSAATGAHGGFNTLRDLAKQILRTNKSIAREFSPCLET